MIGDRVVIEAHAVVVGNVKIGCDVVIAANAFVNFDVPDHSVVLGNPGVIHHKENAAAQFIPFPVETAGRCPDKEPAVK